MKLTPKQIKKLIEQTKSRLLTLGWGCEMYEAIAHDSPKDIRGDLISSSKKLMKYAKKTRKQTAKTIEFLEEILKEDEFLNSWKGEDRYIEL